jgi:hypothetical protein
MGLCTKRQDTTENSPPQPRGVARGDGVVLIQAIDFLNRPPRLDQGGEFAFPCKAPAWEELKTVAAIALLP